MGDGEKFDASGSRGARDARGDECAGGDNHAGPTTADGADDAPSLDRGEVLEMAGISAAAHGGVSGETVPPGNRDP